MNGSNDVCLFLFAQAIVACQRQGENQQGGQLGGERLGRRHTNFRTGLGHDDQIGFPHQRAARHVADGQSRAEASLFGLAQCRQSVGGFTGLGNAQEQGVGLNHVFAVAELGSDFHRTRHAGQFLNPVAGHDAGMVRSATGDDLHVTDVIQQVGRIGSQGLLQDPAVGDPAFHGGLITFGCS